MSNVKNDKVTIIGAGMVGSTIAYSLVVQDIVEEIALIDLNEDLVRAQVMDLQHSAPFAGRTEIRVGSYDDCADSAAVVVACGAAQKVGQTRLDLVNRNVKIIREVVPKVFAANPDTVLVMVTNPVDVLTFEAIRMFPDKKRQIMGTGTILDSARLRHLIGQKLNINPKSIHAYIVGEHGDSEFALWSSASVGNMSLGTCRKLTLQDRREIFEQARNAAYTIIEGKQATYYAIGSGCAHLVRAIVHDKHTVLPVSHLLEGEFGINDVCLSLPVVVGRGGVVNSLCLDLSEEEVAKLRNSAETLKKVIADVERE